MLQVSVQWQSKCFSSLKWKVTNCNASDERDTIILFVQIRRTSNVHWAQRAHQVRGLLQNYILEYEDSVVMNWNASYKLLFGNFFWVECIGQLLCKNGKTRRNRWYSWILLKELESSLGTFRRYRHPQIISDACFWSHTQTAGLFGPSSNIYQNLIFISIYSPRKLNVFVFRS